MPPVRQSAVLLCLLPALLAVPGAASARPTAPYVTRVTCVPATTARCATGVSVRVGAQVRFTGRRFAPRLRVTFRWSSGAIATRLQSSRAGWVVRVPPGTRAGRVRVYVTSRSGARSNARSVTVTAPPAARVTTIGGGDLPGPFRGDGMWIWQLAKAEGGDLGAIVARAQAAHLHTVFVKSSDGPSSRWAQFNPTLVAQLHAAGLAVCAWQFVYGKDPEGEAALGIDAVRSGADCLVIDAETSYEGRYAEAQRYMTALRAGIGPDYPLGLTSFPYVDYHPKLPFSVFLGPGGAQANLPQVYWKDIGGGVDAVSGHTWAHNRIYGRPVAPLGQTYDDPPAAQIRRFRQLWAGYGAAGLSWWSWQHTSEKAWAVLDEAAPATQVEADPGWPALGKGAKGDEVIWLQQHLRTTDPTVGISGTFDAATDAALRNYQLAHALPATGTTDAGTWTSVLAQPVTPVDWTAPAQ